MYYQVNRVFCAALSVESVNPQRIVPGPFFVCVKRDAGDAQAVASWKKSFVRSSTGEEDATSTTVAASAAGGTLGARGDGVRRRRPAASGERRAATAGVISRPPPRRRRRVKGTKKDTENKREIS